MTNLSQPIPRTFGPGETETGAFMNAARDALNALLNPPHFKGVLAASTAITSGTNIAWPSTEDNYAAWDSTNHWWVVPPTWGGLYIANIQFKWGSPLPATNVVIGIVGGAAGTTGLVHTPAPPAVVTNGGMTLTAFVRANAGDKIGIQSLNSGFTSSADTTESMFFEFGFYSQ